MSDLPTNKELAAKINKYLQRFETDPAINFAGRNGSQSGLKPFFQASCFPNGRYIGLCYVSFQHQHMITKAEAIEYLARLDAGFVGRHTDKGKSK